MQSDPDQTADPLCSVCGTRHVSAGPGCPWADCPHNPLPIVEGADMDRSERVIDVERAQRTISFEAIEQEPTEEMIDAGVNAYVKWYGEHDCWQCRDAIVFSEGIAAAYRAMEAARAK